MLFDTLKNQKVPCGANFGGLAPQTPQQLLNIISAQLACENLPPLAKYTYGATAQHSADLG